MPSSFAEVKVTIGGRAASGYANVGGDLGIKANVPDLTQYDLIFGDAAGKVSELVYVRGNLAASTPQTFDLSAILDAAGVTVNLARVKVAQFLNFDTTPGHSYLVDGTVTNGWKALTNGVAGKIFVPPGASYLGSTGATVAGYAEVFFCTPDPTGFAVGGTSKIITLDPGSNAVSATGGGFGFRLWGNLT